MKPDQAAENLQVIRTLMERSAVYRRALAPMMVFTGIMGIVGASVGVCSHIKSEKAFLMLWGGIALLAMAGSFLLVRRQAIRDRESFWSPPTRRVVQAMLPSVFVGAVITVFSLVAPWDGYFAFWRFPQIWALLYGLGLHSAGFFMERGIKWLGYIFIAISAMIYISLIFVRHSDLFVEANITMGASFGLTHLAYGIYLYFTESRKTAP
jgi:hypothetical protein